METPQESIGQRRALMRHQVERIAHQVAVQHRDRGGPGASAQMRQGGEMSLLAFIQRQRPGELNQSFGLGPQARVIRQREHPSFAYMRHGEIGCRLTCRIEQADGVAVYEVERPHCLIVPRSLPDVFRLACPATRLPPRNRRQYIDYSVPLGCQGSSRSEGR
jgi:hypothetical protein